MEERFNKPFAGATKELIAPSGKMFKIREQNGADDDLLSAQNLAKDGENINLFLCNIVLDTDFNESGLNIKTIDKLAIKDKFFLMFSSRIFSIGEDMKFKYDWGMDNGGVVDYVENLSMFLWDYSKEGLESFPKEGSKSYFEHRLIPYKESPYEDKEVTLSTGKMFKFNLMNVEGERRIMTKGNEITKNDELLAMNLRYNYDNTWVEVQNFKMFTKREMLELHAIVNELEKPFYGFSELENPTTGQKELYPLVINPAFFFPLGI